MTRAAAQVEYVSIERAIPMRRVWAMPNANTFDVGPIGGLIRWRLAQSVVSIDPFARNKRWATYTNDLNPNTAAEWHMEAEDFLVMLLSKNVKADLFIFDPPYSPRQLKECYDGIGKKMQMEDGQTARLRAIWRNAALPLLADNAVVISCGWNTVGFGVELGFKTEEILVVCHGADHNDTIVTVERRDVGNQMTLEGYAG